MVLVKKQNPQDCTKVFNKLSEFYERQKHNFDMIIHNPEIYENEFGIGFKYFIGIRY